MNKKRLIKFGFLTGISLSALNSTIDIPITLTFKSIIASIIKQFSTQLLPYVGITYGMAYCFLLLWVFARFLTMRAEYTMPKKTH